MAAYVKEQRCFLCHNKGHMKKDCPKKDSKNANEQSPVDASKSSVQALHLVDNAPSPSISEDPDEALIKCYAHVNGQRLVVLFDTGSAHDGISDSLARRARLELHPVPPLRVSGFSPGMETSVDKECHDVRVNVQSLCVY